jgi:lipopolysaccharide transport system ATP-binding protein
MSRRLLLKMEDARLSYRQRRSLWRSNSHEVIKGINLEIHEGQRLGIIGHNGAGKSTLLRLMAGIYAPDQGRVINHNARVSMLSLQAGFDPRLNGWENALLSGVLMGMTPREARARLPEIHAFCELGTQMDDALNTYSSGMRARLGFAVALAMQVDLLLVDEVLAVGDEQFQQKCQSAIRQAVERGCALVLVSHSMALLHNWTDSILHFEDGTIRAAEMIKR